MKRFFYSGCSFTEYSYPTWADIIAYDLITQGKVDRAFNLGRGGACNDYILTSLLVANQQYNITDNDFVGVGWTTPERHSVINEYVAGCLPNKEPNIDWRTYGSLDNPVWNQIPHHLDIINTELYLFKNTSNAYNALHNLFDIKYETRMNFKELDREFEFPPEGQKFDRYLTNTYNKLINVISWPYLEQTKVQQVFFSSHPSIGNHLDQAKRIADLHPDTISHVMELHNDLYDLLNSLIIKHSNDQNIKCLAGDQIRSWKKNLRNIPGWDCVFTFEDSW